MKVTKKLINSIVKSIDVNSDLYAYDVHIESEENGEFIIRYKDLNDFTCIIYFSNDDDCTVGYLNEEEEEVYTSFCWMKRLGERNKESFIMELGIYLYRLRSFIEDREYKED